VTHPADPDSEDPGAVLERLIARALDEQPLHPAPHTLEEQVLSRIEHRARMPWPGHRFTEWRLPARMGFLFTACLAAALVLLAWSSLATRLATTRAAPVVVTSATGLRTAAGAFADFGELTMQLYRAIPRDWLYGGLLVTSALYLILFGLAAAAYRVLGADTDAAEAQRP
jgi:hypothetical protein